MTGCHCFGSDYNIQNEWGNLWAIFWRILPKSFLKYDEEFKVHVQLQLVLDPADGDAVA